MAEHLGQSGDRNTTNVQSLHNRFVVAAVDFHRTRVYPIIPGDDGRPEKVLDVDPEGHAREIAHKAGNPDGTYENGNPEYWREITDALGRPPRSSFLTTGDVLARARHYFGLAPQRYQGRDPGTPAPERADFPRTDNPGPTN